jgi:hypothetical protein
VACQQIDAFSPEQLASLAHVYGRSRLELPELAAAIAGRAQASLEGFKSLELGLLLQVRLASACCVAGRAAACMGWAACGGGGGGGSISVQTTSRQQPPPTWAVARRPAPVPTEGGGRAGDDARARAATRRNPHPPHPARARRPCSACSAAQRSCWTP